MSIATSLVTAAEEIALSYQDQVARLERQKLETEIELAGIEAALSTARMAPQRLFNFAPTLGANFQCPSCWVDKELASTLHPIPEDRMRCNVCDAVFDVSPQT